MIHKMIPMIVGSKNETSVHFTFLVSLYIVISVVEQGKWKIESIIKFMAVSRFHPFDNKISFIIVTLSISSNVVFDRYIMSAIGNTI